MKKKSCHYAPKNQVAVEKAGPRRLPHSNGFLKKRGPVKAPYHTTLTWHLDILAGQYH